ncbi:MAG: hypothetical protein RLZZ399_742 [Verrucomicrobiota bacterium]
MFPATEFLHHLRSSWQASTFVKLTLSEPEHPQKGPRNLKARPVELKEGRRLCLVHCFPTRETTQNHPPEEGTQLLADALTRDWRRAHLFTTAGDFLFQRQRSGHITVRAQRPTFLTPPSLQHDRIHPEQAALAREPFLQKLGVTNARGLPRPGKAGKLRQIQRFSELLGHLLDECGRKNQNTLRVADMGAGKGYLTFALALALRQRAWSAEIVGIEARPELVAASNSAARELGFPELRFEVGQINQWHPPQDIDVLVALHACNTATDDALFQGISHHATLLLTSPCCHQELRPQLSPPPLLAPLLDHGILLERQAEILTDGIRALLLELHGYRTKVFEFVEPEHSGKNLMLAAIRRESGGRPEASLRSELRNLFEAFQIRHQRLAQNLGEMP